jgi:isochorismate synthase
MPGANTLNLIADFSGNLDFRKHSLEELDFCFALSPFDSKSGEYGLIKPDLYLAMEVGHEQTEELRFSLKNPKLESELMSYLRDKQDDQSLNWHASKHLSTPTSDDWYLHYVEDAVEKIKQEVFHKVVAARNKKVDRRKNLDLLQIFNTLCSSYPNAFVSILSTQNFGTWIGASPETLIALNGQNVFKTTALAGTQKYNKGDQLSGVPKF